MWLVTKDCCGLCCAFFTLGLMFFAEVVQVKYVIGPWKGIYSWYNILYTIFFVLATGSHIRCMTQNPGTVPIDLEVEKEPDCDVIECHHCETVKPRDAHHCRTCERCVLRMDHHCPWVNNCVGYMNQKHFLLFLFWTGVCCLWSLVTLVCRFVMCASVKRSFRPTQPFCLPTPVDTICCVLNFVEGIMFGLFVTIMLFDQLSVIFDNTTLIDKKKGNVKAKRSTYESMVAVFGEAFSPGWFFPKETTQKLKDDFLEACNQLQPKRRTY